MKKKLTAIVAGGGIGGLATGAALAQHGWDVTIYERQNELRAAGAGIYIWENGLRVLEALGAYDDAVKGAFHGRFFEQRDNHGNIIEFGADSAGQAADHGQAQPVAGRAARCLPESGRRDRDGDGSRRRDAAR